VNIVCQALTFSIYGGSHAIQLSVLVGTAVPLPIKYVLEKRLVFGFNADGVHHDARLMVLYTFFGGFTTLLFWATECAFQVSFGTETMRYVGAAIGLTAGYILRYQLDKRFVFVPRSARG